LITTAARTRIVVAGYFGFLDLDLRAAGKGRGAWTQFFQHEKGSTKNPANWRTRRGALNHKLCQYIRGQSDMATGAAD
jgi:hypothetical protein